MSNSVDQRIVQMQFDNSQFQRGIADTMASLKSFEAGLELKDGVSGLSRVQSAVNSLSFDNAIGGSEGFRGALESLQVTAGNVFERISSGLSMVAKGYTIFKALTNTSIAALAIQGGWNRASSINQAEFKLQGLLKDAKKVEEVMAHASEAVNGTAYGLDAAVTAAANLTASGITNGEQLEEVLVTISDLAGTSGRDFDSVANIMGAVAAQGKLMGMQVQQFSMSGLNVTAALAKNLNTTEEEIKDMVSKGNIDFETFARVMKEEFGGNAKNANNTFEGSLANVRAALSRTTADLFQYGQKAMVPVFNGIRESINAVNWALKPLLGTWTETITTVKGDTKEVLKKGTLIKNFEKMVKGVGDAFHTWGGTNKSGANSGYISQGPERFRRLIQEIADGLDKPLSQIAKGSKNFTYALIEMSMTGREIIRLALELLTPVSNALDNVFGHNLFKQFAKSFRYDFADPILNAMASLHVSEGYVNVMTVAFTSLFEVVKTVGGGAISVIGSVIKGIYAIVGGIGLGLGGIFNTIDKLFVSMGNASLALATFRSDLKDFLKTIGMGYLYDGIDHIASAFIYLIRAINGDKQSKDRFYMYLKLINKDVAHVFEIVGDAIGQFAKNVSEFMTVATQFVGGAVGKFFTVVGEFVKDVAPGLYDFAEGLKKFFDTIAMGIAGLSDDSALKQFIDVLMFIPGLLTGNEKAIGIMGQLGDKVKEVFGKIFGKAEDGVSSFGEAFNTFAADFNKNAPTLARTVFIRIVKFAENVRNVFTQAKDFVTGAWDTITSFLSESGFSIDPFIDFFKNAADAMGKFFDDILSGNFNLDSIFDLFEEIGDNAEKLFEKIAPAFENAAKGLSDVVFNVLQDPLKKLGKWISNITKPADELSDNLETNVDTISSVFSGGAFPWQKSMRKGISKSGGFDMVAGVDTEQVVDEGFDFLSAIESLVGFLSHPIETLQEWTGNGIGGISDMLNQFISGIDWNKIDEFAQKIASLGISGGMIYSLYEFGNSLKSMSGLFDAIKEVPESISNVISSFGDVADAAKQNFKTKAILNIAISVGLLVGALVVLSLSDLNKVKEALPILAGLLVGVAGIVMAFGKISMAEGFEAASITAFVNAMLSLAVAVAIMGVVVSILGQMDKAQLDQGRNVVIQFGLIVGILLAITSKFPPNVAGLGATMMGIAGAFFALSVIIGILGAMPEGWIKQGGAALTGLAVGIGILVAIMGAINGMNVKNSSIGLMKLAETIAVLAAVMVVLGHIDQSKLVQGAVALGGLMVAMAIVIGVINATKPKAIVLAANSLFTIAGAVAILAAVLAGLSLVAKVGDLETATGAIVGLMVALALITSVLTNSTSNLNTSMLGLLSLAVVIGILTAALIALSFIDADSLGRSIEALGFALLVFMGALYALSEIGHKLPQSLGAIGAMAVVIVVLTAALIALAQIKPEALLVSVIALGAALIVFTGALAVLAGAAEFFATGIEVINSALVSLGLTIFLISAGVAMFVAAGALFLNTLIAIGDRGPEFADRMIEALQRFCQGLWDSKEQMALGVMGLGFAILSGLMGLIPMAVAALGLLIGELLGALITFIPIIAEGAVLVVAGFIEGLGKGIKEHGGEVLDAVISLFMSIGEAFMNGLSGVVNDFNGWLYEITGGLMGAEPIAHDEAEKLGQGVKEGVESGVDGTAESVEGEMQDATDKVAEFKETLSQATGATFGEVPKAAEGALKNFDLSKVLKLDGVSLDKTFGEIKDLVGAGGVEIPAELQAGMESGALDAIPLGNLMDENGTFDTSMYNDILQQNGVDNADAYIGGYEEKISSYDPTVLFENSGMLDEETISGAFTESGQIAATAFNDSFSNSLNIDGSGPAQKAAKAMQQEASFRKAGNADGSAAMDGLKKGLSNFASHAKDTVNKAIDNVKSKKQAAYDAGYDVGKNLSLGVAKGMESELEYVKQVAAKIIAEIDKVHRKEGDLHSPSKLTAKTGRYLTLGLAVGMEDAIPEAVKSAETVMDKTLTPLMTQAAYISDLALSMDSQPVIRPVLDLTDYNAGLAQMQGFDTATQMVAAQFASSRLFGTASSQQQSGSTTNTISIALNYDAGADANQMVMDIARGLAARLDMEGV